MKPGWKDAPEWANWLAMDASGAWYWYELQPSSRTNETWAFGGKFEHAGDLTPWDETKEQRPEAKP